MSSIFLEFSFVISPLQPASEILMAELGQFPFESFLETQGGLNAYIKKEDFKEEFLDGIQILSHPDFKIEYTRQEIQQQNWNANWEAHFDAIKIGVDCMVRAPFHEKDPQVNYDIEIMPKMSFGTGHHETTRMMLEHLLEQQLDGLSVLDMGSGTGVLAILAAMKGAAHVDAIDIDPWSYLNAKENVQRNGQAHINVYEGDAGVLGSRNYDLILANINRNILLSDIPSYARHLNAKGRLILSGYYESDQSLITDVCEAAGLQLYKKASNNNWVATVFKF